MSDLHHFIGGDLSVSATGDLLAADGPVKTQHRILRRLLTSVGDYLWHPSYGAGVGRLVGQVIDLQHITGLIRGQMLIETSVAQKPEPVIAVRAITDGVSCSIRYTDAVTKTAQTLNFNATV